jgi:hypothetical protein
MQHELIFRGSLVQYWKVIFAQWQRSSASLGEPPFKIPTPSPGTAPIANCLPKENETLAIVFYDEKHREIVAVFADAVLGKNIVKLTVFYNDEAFEKRGESAVARWNKLQRLMERKGWLIDPLAQYQAKKERGMQERTKNKIESLREIRLDDLEENGSVRSRKSAMDEVKITDKTWRKWDRKTYDNWEIKSYKPGKYLKTE